MGTDVERARDQALRTGRVQQLLDSAGREAEELGLDSAEDAILVAVAEDGALGKVAQRFGVSRAAVQAWIRTDPERLRPLIAEAREQAADLIAEEAGEVLDGLTGEITSARVSLANSRSNYRRWLAGVWSDTYKEKRGPDLAVNVNVGSLYLEALQAEGTRRSGSEVVEAEVLEVEDGHELGSGEHAAKELTAAEAS